MSSSASVDSGSRGSNWERSICDKQRGEGGESRVACAPGDKPCTPLYPTAHTFLRAQAGHKMVPAHRRCACDIASRRREGLDQQLLQSEMILLSERGGRQLL